jgi:DNA repair exonuclease SbcCD nuclease subunit
VRFTGAGYLGAATPHKVRQIVERLEPGRSHVLLLHAGPDYFVGEGGGFSGDDLRGIQEKVRYLALGHIHKPMLHGGWACNPGSPENCELREALYDGDRGYAIIELDPTDPARPISLQIASNPRRPCLLLELDCTPYGNKLKDGVAAIEKAALKLIVAHLAPPNAVIELRLTGRINLNRLALDAAELGRSLEAAAGVAVIAVNPAAINLDDPLRLGPHDPETSREDLERAALRELVDAENLWGLDGEQETVARLLFELKEAIRTGQPARGLAETIRAHPLVEKIRTAEIPAPVS